MTLDTNALFQEFTGGLQRLTRGPFERSPLFVLRHDRLLAAGTAPDHLPNAHRALLQEHAAEVLLERGKYLLQVAMRDRSRRVVLVELQRMTAGAMLLHANRRHEASAGIGLMAITARELLIAGGGFDAVFVHMDLVRKLQIGMLFGVWPKPGRAHAGAPHEVAAVALRFEQRQREIRMAAAKIRDVLQGGVGVELAQVPVAGDAGARTGVDQPARLGMLHVTVRAAHAGEARACRRFNGDMMLRGRMAGNAGPIRDAAECRAMAGVTVPADRLMRRVQGSRLPERIAG